MNFEQKMKRIERMLDIEEYTIAAKECVGLIEQALRKLFRRYLPLLNEKDRAKFQKAELETGKGDKGGIEHFTMGQLVRVFYKSGFLDAWARVSGRDLGGIRLINLNELNQLRNKFIHLGREAARAEAEFLLHCLQVILGTFDIVSLEEAPLKNPYTSRNMVTDFEAFFGRNREIEEIFTNLNQGFQNTSIVGERRSGKSSLLWHLSQSEVYKQYTHDGDNPFLFIFFDLQRVAGLTQAAFFKLLSKNLVSQLPETQSLVPEDFDSSQEYFSELVQEACVNFRIVICLDEFETFATSDAFNKDFLQNMRSYANQGQVAYITSSRELLDVICQDTEHIMGSDFWNIFISPPLYLGLLEEAEAIELITTPSAQAGIPFQQPEIDFILETAGHHPLFLQIACFHLFEVKKGKLEANAQGAISHVERNQIVNNFFMGACPHFDQVWKRLSSLEKKVLANCSEIDPGGEYKHTINGLIKRGLLLIDPQLHPFCNSFERFIQENYRPDREAQPDYPAGESKETPTDISGYKPDSAQRFVVTPPPKKPSKYSRLDIWFGQKGQVLLNLDGPHSIALFCPNQVNFDVTTINWFDMRVRNIPQVDDWRLEKQEIGRDLEELFRLIPELSQIYTEGRAIVGDDECFLITFKCPKEMIAFPFEFMNTLSSVDDSLKHLVLCHPIRKSILGIRTRRKPLAPDFYADQQVKMLLVSSNVSGHVRMNNKTYTLSEISGANREVHTLESMIADLQKTGKVTFSADVKCDVTRDEMADLLQYGGYDIVHYSGHGFFAESPENSCLFFWEKPGGRNVENRIATLSATELNTMVEHANIRFMYLSCCQGGTAGTIDQLLYNDFLGISYSLIVGGVPAVLAMRWPLSDDMAELLASSFYKELFTGKGLELALFYARKRVQSKNPNDYNWLSPMLIMQGD